LSLPERPPPLEVELVDDEVDVGWLASVEDGLDVLKVVPALPVYMEEMPPEFESKLRCLEPWLAS
jgi:hypothetical protein